MTIVYVKQIDNETVQLTKAELEKLINDAYERGKQEARAQDAVPIINPNPIWVNPIWVDDKTHPWKNKPYIGDIPNPYEITASGTIIGHTNIQTTITV